VDYAVEMIVVAEAPVDVGGRDVMRTHPEVRLPTRVVQPVIARRQIDGHDSQIPGPHTRDRAIVFDDIRIAGMSLNVNGTLKRETLREHPLERHAEAVRP